MWRKHSYLNHNSRLNVWVGEELCIKDISKKRDLYSMKTSIPLLKKETFTIWKHLFCYLNPEQTQSNLQKFAEIIKYKTGDVAFIVFHKKRNKFKEISHNQTF